MLCVAAGALSADALLVPSFATARAAPRAPVLRMDGAVDAMSELAVLKAQLKELKEMQQATMEVQGITPPAIQAPVELAQAAVTTPPPALVQPDAMAQMSKDIPYFGANAATPENAVGVVADSGLGVIDELFFIVGTAAVVYGLWTVAQNMAIESEQDAGSRGNMGYAPDPQAAAALGGKSAPEILMNGFDNLIQDPTGWLQSNTPSPLNAYQPNGGSALETFQSPFSGVRIPSIDLPLPGVDGIGSQLDSLRQRASGSSVPSYEQPPPGVRSVQDQLMDASLPQYAARADDMTGRVSPTSGRPPTPDSPAASPPPLTGAASAGGAAMAVATAVSPVVMGATRDPAADVYGGLSVPERMAQLKALLRDGVVTEEEYEQAKRAIVDSI